MAKVKSIIMEKDIGFLLNADVHFVSLVGHAANRQPFKIIKGEVIKGDKDMTKQTIYKVLVKKGVTDNKLQDLMTEHKFSADQKDETALEGYDVYKQVEDAEVDLDTRNMASLSDDAYVIIADLKEDSEKEGLEKEEVEYETMEKVADSLFAMVDIVLGTIRQPEAQNRKEMIMSAVTNFSNYAGAVLSNMKAEDVLGDFEIKSEIIKGLIKTDTPVEKEAFDLEVFKQEFGDSLKAEFEKFVDEKVNAVKGELSETKDTLNTSLNDQFALYTKKEDLEKELAVVKTELEDLKNTTKKRNSDMDEETIKTKKTEKREFKPGQFKTFV